MKFGKHSILPVILFSAIIIISACTPSRVSVEEYDQVPTSAATSPPETGEEVPPEPVETQESAPVEEQDKNTLDDVPIMEGAYQVQKGSSGRNVLYTVDAEIDDVVGFYQAELPNYGWEMAGPPDNAVSAIATMLRENNAGDRLAVNMQYNSLGGFVRVTITISRAD